MCVLQVVFTCLRVWIVLALRYRRVESIFVNASAKADPRVYPSKPVACAMRGLSNCPAPAATALGWRRHDCWLFVARVRSAMDCVERRRLCCLRLTRAALAWGRNNCWFPTSRVRNRTNCVWERLCPEFRVPVLRGDPAGHGVRHLCAQRLSMGSRAGEEHGGTATRRFEDWEETTPVQRRRWRGGVGKGCHQKWTKVTEGLSFREFNGSFEKLWKMSHFLKSQVLSTSRFSKVFNRFESHQKFSSDSDGDQQWSSARAPKQRQAAVAVGG